MPALPSLSMRDQAKRRAPKEQSRGAQSVLGGNAQETCGTRHMRPGIIRRANAIIQRKSPAPMRLGAELFLVDPKELLELPHYRAKIMAVLLRSCLPPVGGPIFTMLPSDLCSGLRVFVRA